MKLYIGLLGLVFFATYFCTACENSQAVKEVSQTPHPPRIYSMKITIDKHIFYAELLDNPAARALLGRLPMKVTMQELNKNEKYYYLPSPLPVNAQPVGHIQTGDIMLFGNNCLVLFYKDFKSSYSYTRLGYITNPQHLEKFIGQKDILVSFSL